MAIAAGGAVLLLARRGRFAALGVRVRARLSGVTLTKRAVAGAAALFVGGWPADAALVTSFLAIGVAAMERAHARLLRGPLVSFPPITPGGVGFVEGSLTLALVAGGGNVSSALAAVLLYRIVSYWGTLPAGGIGYLGLRRGRIASLGGDDQPFRARGDQAPRVDRPQLVLERGA